MKVAQIRLGEKIAFTLHKKMQSVYIWAQISLLYLCLCVKFGIELGHIHIMVIVRASADVTPPHCAWHPFPWFPLLACSWSKWLWSTYIYTRTGQQSCCIYKTVGKALKPPALRQSGGPCRRAVFVSVCVLTMAFWVSVGPLAHTHTHPAKRKISSLKQRYTHCPRPLLSTCLLLAFFLHVLMAVPEELSLHCKRLA